MNLLRIARSSPVGLVLVFLMVGCGGSQSSPPVTDSAASQPATEAAASPSAEGSGPETPQQGDNGGLTIKTAALPIGGGPAPGDSGHDACFTLAWNAQPLPSGVIVTVTRVDVESSVKSSVEGSYALAGGCGSPQCAGFQFSANSSHCNVDVTWDPNKPPTTDGSLALIGTPTCPSGDTAACQQFLDQQGSTIPIPAPASDQSSPTA
jgi:hypothetical protein